MAVLPDAEHALGVVGLRRGHAHDVVGDDQAVVDRAAAGVGLHAHAAGEAVVGAVGAAVAGDLDQVGGDALVAAEGEMDADVLVDVRRRDGGVEVGRQADAVALDAGAVEGVAAAGAEEHADAEVEVEDLEVADGPVAVLAAVEDQEALEVGLGQVAGALDHRRAAADRFEYHAVDVGRHQHRVVVGRAGAGIGAQRPGGGRVGLAEVEGAVEAQVDARGQCGDRLRQAQEVVVGGRGRDAIGAHRAHRHRGRARVDEAGGEGQGDQREGAASGRAWWHGIRR